MAKMSQTEENAPAAPVPARIRSLVESSTRGASRRRAASDWTQQLSPDERQALDRLIQPALVVIGDAHGQAGPENAAEMLLRWGIAWLRPDRAPVLHVTDRQAWLERASWRPFIALVCHFGLAAIPRLPRPLLPQARRTAR